MRKIKIAKMGPHPTINENLEALIKSWRKYFPVATPPDFMDWLLRISFELLEAAIFETAEGFGEGTLENAFTENVWRLYTIPRYASMRRR